MIGSLSGVFYPRSLANYLSKQISTTSPIPSPTTPSPPPDETQPEVEPPPSGFVWVQIIRDDFNPGISNLIGEYLENLDDDNINVRTDAALHLMVLAGSDIPEAEKRRMVVPLAMALSHIFNLDVMEDLFAQGSNPERLEEIAQQRADSLDMQRYLTRALSQLINLDLSDSQQDRIYDVLIESLQSTDERTFAFALRALPQLISFEQSAYFEGSALELVMDALSSAGQNTRTNISESLLALVQTDLPAQLQAKICRIFLPIFADLPQNLQPEVARFIASAVPANIPEDLKIYALPPLLMAAGEDSFVLPENASSLLAELAEGEKSLETRIIMVPLFLRMLRSEDIDTRYYAARALECLSATDIPPELKISMIDPLLQALGRTGTIFFLSPDPASSTLINLVPSLPDSEIIHLVQGLIQVLQGPDEPAQREAARTLCKLAGADLTPDVKALLVDPLINLTADESISLAVDRTEALVALALSDIPPDQKIRLAEPLLAAYEADAFSDEDQLIRSIMALAELDLPANLNLQLFELLMQAYESYDILLGDIAPSLIAFSAIDISPEMVVRLFPLLLQTFEDEPNFKREAARGIVRLLSTSASNLMTPLHLDPLYFSLEDDDPGIRRSASRLLVQLVENTPQLSRNLFIITRLLSQYEAQTADDKKMDMAICLAYLINNMYDNGSTINPYLDINQQLVAALLLAFEQLDPGGQIGLARYFTALVTADISLELKNMLASPLINLFERGQLDETKQEMVARGLAALATSDLPVELRASITSLLLRQFGLEGLTRLNPYSGSQEAPSMREIGERFKEIDAALAEGDRLKVLGLCTNIMTAFPDSVQAIWASFYIKIIEDNYALSASQTLDSGMVINTYSPTEAVDTGEIHLVFQNDQLFTIIPGNITFSGSQLTVDNYWGCYQTQIIFKDYPNSLGGNNLMLQASQHEIHQFFRNIQAFEFDDTFQSCSLQRECYDHDGKIVLGSTTSMMTFVHEVFHFWDAYKANFEIEGPNFQHDDPTDELRIFYNISWESANDDGAPVWQRRTNDIDDFRGSYLFTGCKSLNCRTGPNGLNVRQDPHPYGMENPAEDLAMVGEEYIFSSTRLRNLIREQMAEGNFELALKYLFIKYLSPFNGAEFDTNDDNPPLTLEEVENMIRRAVNVEPSIIISFNEIKRLIGALPTIDQASD